MQLGQALRIEGPARLAMVGAGGKTTALFQLARELSRPEGKAAPTRLVLVSVSTHLAEEQCRLADYHIILQSPTHLAGIAPHLRNGVVLFTGAQQEAGRISGPGLSALEGLFHLSQVRDCPLLVEADGSRLRPVKAPAEHEPVIPEWVDAVVVLSGLSAIGKPLNSDWVHRPERFAQLSGLPMEQLIHPSALTNVLAHPEGGLKSIPGSARRMVLLNQADTEELQAVAHGMSDQLLGSYHAVVVASLAPIHLQIPQIGKGAVVAVHERVAGIVLAAGGSNRLGQPKQVLPWRGKPLVRHVAEAGLNAGLYPLIIVTGNAGSDVEAALHDLPVITINNLNWSEGQSTSLKAGLKHVPPEAGAVIFLLADQPLVSVDLLRSLVDVHASTLSPLVAPLVQGQRANPVLFDRLTFPELFALQGDVGGRPLFSRYRATWLPWHDPAILLDVDTPEDYQRLLEE